MSELTELAKAMRKLKRDSVENSRLITELEKEKRYLDERNKYLIEKLKQAGVIYEEAGKKVMYFVNENITPLREKFNEFDERLKEVKAYDKSINSALTGIAEFQKIMGAFKTEMLKTEEKQALMNASMKDLGKRLAENSKRISTVQNIGSEELAEKVEEIKERFGEDVKTVEDEFNVFKMGVGNTIEDFRKDFVHEATILRKEMENVDQKKAKELYESMQRTADDMTKTKKEFYRYVNSINKDLERLDSKKSKELDKSMEMLATNLDARFKDFSNGVGKRVRSSEKELVDFKIELERSMTELRDNTKEFVDAKTKEIDDVTEELRTKTAQGMDSVMKEWNDNLNTVKREMLDTKNEMEKLIAIVNRKVELGEERRNSGMEKTLVEMQETVSGNITELSKDVGNRIGTIQFNFEKTKSDLSKTVNSFRKTMEKTEGKKRQEIDKILKEFISAKGQVDEKINEVS
ncbi:MAG: hypothetical protein KAS04_01910, partial [Candidatus Aenigmarchaeota archaeon]|nr:hypothetical protein [Candidatus Aenigmarchaeota archaeon]